MITRLHKILIGLLIVQLVLVIVMSRHRDDSAALVERPILAGFDAAKVTRVQVFAGDTPKPAVELAKRGSSWVLASHFDFPVEDTKVNDVLSPIAKLAAAAPVATQPGRHKQLRVADHDFERKLVITSADGKDVTLYLGNSVGTRRTAIRLGGSDDVYGGANLSAFAFGGEPAQWIDTSYLKKPREDIVKLTIQRPTDSVVLALTEPPAAGSGSGMIAARSWAVTIAGAPVQLAAGETIDLAAVDKIVGDASTITLTAPADPKRDASHPTATITLEHKSTAAITPAPTIIDVIADGDSYWVHDRASTRAVLVAKSALSSVIEVDRTKVVAKPAPPPPPPTPAKAGSGAPQHPG